MAPLPKTLVLLLRSQFSTISRREDLPPLRQTKWSFPVIQRARQSPKAHVYWAANHIFQSKSLNSLTTGQQIPFEPTCLSENSPETFSGAPFLASQRPDLDAKNIEATRLGWNHRGTRRTSAGKAERLPSHPVETTTGGLGREGFGRALRVGQEQQRAKRAGPLVGLVEAKGFLFGEDPPESNYPYNTTVGF